MASAPARFAASLDAFLNQYWMGRVRWDNPDNAYMQCAVATKSFLTFLMEQGYDDLYYVEVLGGRDFDPNHGKRIGSRHYHVLARVGTVYIDLTYRQFEGQEETPWPLILDAYGIDNLWHKRRETTFAKNFEDFYTQWPELYR